jgi:tRNA (adenine22-N1)-methyltransferase
MKLSNRLQKIADEITTGETMADIGTDHGFLPIYLWEKGISPHVIFSDISRGSLEKARLNCEQYIAEGTYDCRLGDGIDILSPGEVDDIVIAGMGGNLIAEIMGKDKALTRSFGKFILQPRNNIGRLRRWLCENQYDIVNEQLVREGRFICVIITCVFSESFKGNGDMTDSGYEYPDWLIKFRNDLTQEYLMRERAKNQKIVQRIEKNSTNAETDSIEARNNLTVIDSLLKELRK